LSDCGPLQKDSAQNRFESGTHKNQKDKKNEKENLSEYLKERNVLNKI
jgi:hypothetical protein